MKKRTDTDQEPTTRVVFRRWKTEGREVFALFPDLPATSSGLVTCYAHVGQHHAADYPSRIARSRPATPDEYKALAVELTSIGYRLRVVKRR